MTLVDKSAKSSRPIWLGQDKRTWDHARIHLQLLHDSRIGAHEIAVYVGLVAHAETQSGRCFPAAETLARYANLSERTVRDVVANLEKCGYISLERTPGKAHNYTILPPPTLAAPSDVGINPGSSFQDPGSSFRGTPEARSDEREPVTRTNNKKGFSTGEVATARFPDTRARGCEQCDGGWVMTDDGAAPCSNCSSIAPSVGESWAPTGEENFDTGLNAIRDIRSGRQGA